MTSEAKRIACVFGVPMDLGQQRRGVDMGPSAVRYAGLQDRLARLGYIVHDGGNIRVPVVEEIARQPGEDEFTPVTWMRLSRYVRPSTSRWRSTLQQQEIAIFLGGDHSISMGTVAGVAHRSAPGVI